MISHIHELMICVVDFMDSGRALHIMHFAGLAGGFLSFYFYWRWFTKKIYHSIMIRHDPVRTNVRNNDTISPIISYPPTLFFCISQTWIRVSPPRFWAHREMKSLCDSQTSRDCQIRLIGKNAKLGQCSRQTKLPSFLRQSRGIPEWMKNISEVFMYQPCTWNARAR